jgi:hypothetical protein
LKVRATDTRITRSLLLSAKQSLPANLSRPSKLRKISLNRLEQAVAKSVKENQKISSEMVALAGMTRLEYVFFYPGSNDIVLAGPAEGFGTDSNGRLLGVDSGQPCLQLDDLIVALRAYAPNAAPANTISVSIDPTQEGLGRLQQMLKHLGGQFRSPSDIPVIVRNLQHALGLNQVTIKGVPAGTHFAHVLTEADYRMKLIGIGLEPAPANMTNYISRLTAADGSSNALMRWYFVPNYESIGVTEDGLGMQLVGSGVKLVEEGELVTNAGRRKSSGRGNAASRGFTAEFTKKFPQIAKSEPVFAQLRNLIDLAVAAAYIRDSDLYSKSNWELGVFADEDQFSVQRLPPPQSVETAINAIMKDGTLITPIGGGVAIQARKLIERENLKADKQKSIQKVHSDLKLDDLADGQWWWD